MLFTYSKFKDYSFQHFTTTTEGGVSRGSYSSFNLCPHSGDDVGNVVANRTHLVQMLGVGIEDLYIPHQTHEDKIRVIDQYFLSLSAEEKLKKLHGIDALVTAEKDICIGVTTADCVPISIYDPQNHVLGIAHAGWKGTVARIGTKIALRMRDEFSSDLSHLVVGIGPSISQEMFEVGDEVGAEFQKNGFDLNTISYRKAETGKLHINLWQANKEQLLHLGVKESNIEVSGVCTYQSESFFSARRQTIKSGRILTGGVLR